MNDKTLKAVTAHGNKLLRIFPNAIEKDPVKLCRKLRRLENKANKHAADYCNGYLETEGWEKVSIEVLGKVRDVLDFDPGFPVFVNGDCRGYSLKIDDEYVRANKLDIHTDLGGYGILAPDLTA